MVLVYKYYNLLCEKIRKAAEVSSSSGRKKKIVAALDLLWNKNKKHDLSEKMLI